MNKLTKILISFYAMSGVLKLEKVSRFAVHRVYNRWGLKDKTYKAVAHRSTSVCTVKYHKIQIVINSFYDLLVIFIST